ncbi:MAG: hypothetical protein LBV23_08750 [Deltaproteobacteria bacterium]|jgi:hypothetical protein|nr:hypothetical protein [Deltaproteobacteria bacterium]
MIKKDEAGGESTCGGCMVLKRKFLVCSSIAGIITMNTDVIKVILEKNIIKFVYT